MKTSLCLILFVSALSCGSAEFDLGKRGKITLEIPRGWIAKGDVSEKPGQEMGYSIAIMPPGSQKKLEAMCILAIPYDSGELTNMTSMDAIKERFRKGSGAAAVSNLLSASVEKEFNFKEFSIEKGFGGYFVLTDASLVGKKLTPGQFRVKSMGVLVLNEELRALPVIMAEDADSKNFTTMLKIINSVKLNPKKEDSKKSAK